MTSAIHDAIQVQAEACRTLGSPFSATVLALVAQDVAAGGPFSALFAPWDEAPFDLVVSDAAPLRALGGLHHLVLGGDEPGLAAAYPASGGPCDPTMLASTLADVATRRRSELQAFMALPPQTNEVRRSAALLGGFLTIAAETGLPLRCLELGSSAGLNQAWDRYAYRLGDAGEFGPEDSPLRIEVDWRGPAPPSPPWPQVVERRGCDQAPVDLADPAQALRLKAYVWADQLDRLARLDAAASLARESGVRVERADAAAWAEANLRPAKGAATVLFHSIFWQYLAPETRERLTAVIEAVGWAATRRQPFAWLRMEPTADYRFEVRLTIWPDGEERLLADVHPHGAHVSWRSGAESVDTPHP